MPLRIAHKHRINTSPSCYPVADGRIRKTGRPNSRAPLLMSGYELSVDIRDSVERASRLSQGARNPIPSIPFTSRLACAVWQRFYRLH
eukprot:1137140-Prymnesium_polylepis.1